MDTEKCHTHTYSHSVLFTHSHHTLTNWNTDSYLFIIWIHSHHILNLLNTLQKTCSIHSRKSPQLVYKTLSALIDSTACKYFTTAHTFIEHTHTFTVTYHTHNFKSYMTLFSEMFVYISHIHIYISLILEQCHLFILWVWYIFILFHITSLYWFCLCLCLIIFTFIIIFLFLSRCAAILTSCKIFFCFLCLPAQWLV